GPGCNMAPSPKLSALIQRRIDEIEAESFGAWPVRVCKENLNALPLHGNLIYIWALQPDRTVVWMDHESASHESDVETDPLTIFSVMNRERVTTPSFAPLCRRDRMGQRSAIGAGEQAPWWTTASR